MKKSLYILSITVFLSSLLKAQDTKKDTVFTRDVNIVRSYTPTINDAGKINTLPQIEKPEVIKSDVKYSTWTSPLSTQFNLQILPSATLKRMRQQRELREGYAKIGVGNYTSFLGDLYVPLMKREDYSLDFSMKHLSTFGKVKINDSTKVKAQNMSNAAQLSFTKNFYNIDMYSELNFSRNDFNYYGTDSVYVSSIILPPGEVALQQTDILLPNEAHNFFDIKVGFTSRPKIGGMNYGMSMRYALTNTATDLSENYITTQGYLKSNLLKNEYGVNLSLENLFYNKPDSTTLYFHDAVETFKTYSILGLNPYYLVQESGDWNVRIGFKTFFSFNKGKAAYATPDIVGNLTLVKDLFYLYGGIVGDFKTGSTESLFKENTYVRPDIHLNETYTPIDAYAGLKFKLFEYMVFNGYLGYKFIDNQYFFVNRQIAQGGLLGYNNSFDVVTDQTGLFNVGASLTYNLDKRLSTLLKVTYNSWDLTNTPYAWYKPKWETDFDLNYRVNDDIQISLNMFMLGNRYASTNGVDAIELKPVFDCNLEGIYEYNSWLYFFLKVNNILAQNYQMWYGYNTQQFNAMAGVMLSF